MTTTNDTRAVDAGVAASSNPEALLRIATVQALTGLGRSTIFKRVAKRTFPAPLKLGHRTALWKAGEVNAWLQNPTPTQ